MASALLHIDVRPVDADRFHVTSKIEGVARLERTVMASSLPFYVQSVVELAVETAARRGAHLMVQSPDAVHHG